MNTNDIKNKLTQFQSTLTLLQKEEKNITDELNNMGIKTIEEATSLVKTLSEEDIVALEKEIHEVESELSKWLAS